LTAARRALGDVAMTSAWNAGWALSPEQAVQRALDPRAAPDGRDPLGGAGRTPGALSPREREVAMLVARGYTNQQIASDLVISEATVASHVVHILAKLAFSSRAQIAAWVVEQGLLGEGRNAHVAVH